jgi:hypothetical protein
MHLRSALRAASVVVLLSLACACGGGSGTGNSNPPNPPPPPQANWYVSSTTGSDGGAGSAASPFRSITYACSQASSGQTIQVLPGTYDIPNGEVFPIVVPAGVILLGDEINKGGGISPTTISGGGLVPLPNVNANFFAAVVPQTGVTVAGFRVLNDPTPPTNEFGVFLQAAGVTIRNNRILDAQGGIQCRGGFGGHVISGNVLQGHGGAGLFFVEDSGIGAKIENNVITLNAYGVEYDSAGGDLGGGAAASTGGNVFSCNTNQDLWTSTAMITINAANNRWDHNPPTLGGAPGNDIFNGAGATIVTTGPTVAPGACP